MRQHNRETHTSDTTSTSNDAHGECPFLLKVLADDCEGNECSKRHRDAK